MASENTLYELLKVKSTVNILFKIRAPPETGCCRSSERRLQKVRETLRQSSIRLT